MADKRYCRCSDDGRPEFYGCGNLSAPAGFVHQRRTMGCMVLIYVLAGELHISAGGRLHDVKSGEYILLRAGEEHFGTQPSSEDISYFWVHFKCGEWRGADAEELRQTAGKGYIAAEHAAERGGRLPQLFRQLLDLSLAPPPYREKLAACSLELLLTELSRECCAEISSSSNEFSPLITSVREWTAENCARRLTIAEIAAQFHYNAEYLSSIFKKETGETLSAYLLHSRIERSKALLTAGASVKEAAFSSGFSDEKYFMRQFRRLEGTTPLRFKNAFAKKKVNNR